MYKSKIYVKTEDSKTVYAFSFDYISRNFIKVQLGNKTLAYSKDYTVEDKTVILKKPTKANQNMVIYRETPTTRQVQWQDSSILRANDLNLFSTQLLHINEEALDKLTEASIQIDKDTNKWNARHLQIENLPLPTKKDEAVTLEYLDNKQDGYTQTMKNILKTVGEITEKAKEYRNSAKAIVGNEFITRTEAKTLVKKSEMDSVVEDVKVQKQAVDTKVKSLESTVDTKTKALESTVDTKVKLLASTVDTKVKSLESTVDTKVKSLESTVDTKVKALDSKTKALATTIDTKTKAPTIKDMDLIFDGFKHSTEYGAWRVNIDFLKPWDTYDTLYIIYTDGGSKALYSTTINVAITKRMLEVAKEKNWRRMKVIQTGNYLEITNNSTSLKWFYSETSLGILYVYGYKQGGASDT